ncbi:MAG: FAD-dependent oxidoreductase, partial [Streptomycetaceae bacterium]|nr:FAD-dependent oxidoreductase [Streptomycetaceae bacterium]
MSSLRHVVVVGAGAAGLAAVETLRREGFDGALTLLGEEPLRPYDRPPLSKQVLTGAWDPERTQLREAEHYEGLDVRVVHGRAVGLDARGRVLRVADGRADGPDGRARTAGGTDGRAADLDARGLEVRVADGSAADLDARAHTARGADGRVSGGADLPFDGL